MTTGPTLPGGRNELVGALFDTQATNYDRFRAGYPDRLFERLVNETGVGPNSRLVEIGPGTGQATIHAAERGLNVLAVEPGSHMIGILEPKLAPYPSVNILHAKFEDADLPEDTFDLVLAATSLHWVAEAYRFRKPYDLLRAGGHLAVIRNLVVAQPEDMAFFEAIYPITEAYDVRRLNPLELSSN